MKRKNIYKSGTVDEVRLGELLPMLMTGCIVALDVAKGADLLRRCKFG